MNIREALKAVLDGKTIRYGKNQDCLLKWAEHSDHFMWYSEAARHNGWQRWSFRGYDEMLVGPFSIERAAYTRDEAWMLIGKGKTIEVCAGNGCVPLLFSLCQDVFVHRSLNAGCWIPVRSVWSSGIHADAKYYLYEESETK